MNWKYINALIALYLCGVISGGGGMITYIDKVFKCELREDKPQ